MSKIADNIKMLEEEKAAAAIRSGRRPEDVLLCAVTKNHTPEEMNEAIDAGVTDIGENRVQEILEKYENVKKVNWHMIGHLQTNKVKYIIDKVCMIHSVDSLHLAEEIDRDILESCPHVRVRGLMTIAPYAEDPEEVRPYFREMKQLYDRLAIIKHDHLDFKYLSMGMSNDRVIAVEEGSTVIRVGTAIFGARTYNV